MFFLMVLEFVTVAIFIVLVVTQVVIPLWQGKRLFPLLIGKRRDLDRSFAEAGEEVDTARVEKAVRKRKKEAESIRGRSAD